MSRNLEVGPGMSHSIKQLMGGELINLKPKKKYPVRGLLTGYGFLKKASFAIYRVLPSNGERSELQAM